ncbi:MAG TPA: class I SAM-dependent methyltransferase [Rhodocyclaceae bacterium]|nr:class I SAM-dependent methyltransferase [Rhodocyclaceae bacterium]
MDWPTFWDAKAAAGNDFQATGRGLMGVPGYLHTVAEIVRLLDLRQGETLADVGCGTGLIAMSLAPWLSRIDAVDISPAMVERARANLGDMPNVVLAPGSLTELPLGAASVDKLLAYSVLQYLGSVEAVASALREVGRVLKPGGRALLAANPDPARRPAYEDTVRGRSDGEAVAKELALLDDLLWLSAAECTRQAAAAGLAGRAEPISPRIWQHFYMFDLVVEKPK